MAIGVRFQWTLPRFYWDGLSACDNTAGHHGAMACKLDRKHMWASASVHIAWQLARLKPCKGPSLLLVSNWVIDGALRLRRPNVPVKKLKKYTSERKCHGWLIEIADCQNWWDVSWGSLWPFCQERWEQSRTKHSRELRGHRSESQQSQGAKPMHGRQKMMPHVIFELCIQNTSL